LVSQNRTQEDVMAHRIGPSRGDRRRNARKARLRSLMPREYAIVGVDLADEKQVFALCDLDGKVIGRRFGEGTRVGADRRASVGA
jgi:transposase